MTHAHQSLAAQFAAGDGALVVGDVGFVVLKALLENGVGYLVTGWHERDHGNPLDLAIADVHDTILASHGVLLRRMREHGKLATLLRSGVRAGAAVRGAVVWHGDRDMLDDIDRFTGIEVDAPVVGFCFDPGVLASGSALVFDPEPTPRGVVRAVDQAMAASHALGRPTVVLLRERATAMRGTLRCRDNMPVEAAAALVGGIEPAATRADALVAVGGFDVVARGASAAVLCGAPAAVPVRRSIAALSAVAGLHSDVCLVSLAAPTALPESEFVAAVGGGAAVLVLESHESREQVADAVAAQHGRCGAVARRAIDLDTATELELFDTVAAWLVGLAGREHDADVGVAVARARPAGRGLPADIAAKLPPRGAALPRELPATIAAGLTLAQASIGIPARVDAGAPTYQCETGAMLTVIDARSFLEAGVVCATPAGRSGVFVVLASADEAAAVSAAAANAGALAQLVDGSQPLELARALAQSCAFPQATAHVLVVVPVPAVHAVTAGATAGCEPTLLGADRIAASVIDESCLELVNAEHELQGAPVMVPRHGVGGTDARRPAVLSPAWYRVQSGASSSRVTRFGQSMSASLLRAVLRMEV